MPPDMMDAKLAELKREAQRKLRPVTRPVRPTAVRETPRRVWPAVVLGILKVAVVVALPFLVYVRASVGLYLHGGASPWMSVAGAALLTLGVAAVYAAWLSRRFSGRVRTATMTRWVALPLTAAWCGCAALYLARVNAKSDAVRSYYGSVHPVLRVALATAILGDAGVVVTDMRRVPQDYARMGLPVNDCTKHFRQADGWVHAVDLRTRERGEIRNRALQLYFWTMGFDTLRHVGTADHLHVQLALRK